jgi:hypothetical protein
MSSKLVFLSDNVKESDFFKQSLLPDVQCIQLNSRDSVSYVKDKLLGLDLSDIKNIAVIFDNTLGKAPFIEYTLDELQRGAELQLEFQKKLEEQDKIREQFSIEYDDDNNLVNNSTTLVDITRDNYLVAPSFHSSNLFFSTDFYNILIEIKNKSKLDTIDIISCNTRHNLQFDDFLALGITVRYSTNITGLGGDWILESHGINVAPEYFTSEIVNYKYKLGAETPGGPDANGNYTIGNASQLYWLMTFESNTGPQVPNLSSSFIITDNIDMNDVDPNPALYPTVSIGRKTNSTKPTTSRFIGTLKGNNKTVIIRTIDFTDFSGFIGNFGNTSGSGTPAILENITIKYAPTTFGFIVPTVAQFTGSTNLFCGLLAGLMARGSITNSRVEFIDSSSTINISINNQINVDAPLGGQGLNFGLLVGRKERDSNVQNCTVSHSGTINITGLARFGYSIGSFMGQSTSPTTSSIISGNLVQVNNLNITAGTNYTATSTPTFNIGGFIGGTITQGVNALTTFSNNNFNCSNINIVTTPLPLSIANLVCFTHIGLFIGLLGNNVTINSCNVSVSNLSSITYGDSSGGGGTAQHFFVTGCFCGKMEVATAAVTCRIQNCQANILTFSLVASVDDLTTARPFIYLGGFCGEVRQNNEITGSNRVNITDNNITITAIGPLANSGEVRIAGGVGSITDINVTLSGLNCNIIQGIHTLSLINSGILFGSLVGNVVNNAVITSNVVTYNNIVINSSTITTQNIFIGGMAGNVSGASSIINNNTNLTISTFIINCAGRGNISIGGLIGRTLSSPTITTSNINIGQLNIVSSSYNTSGTSETSFGGLVGRPGNTTSIQNCRVNIGPNSSVISLLNNLRIWMGGLIGLLQSTGLIANNTVILGNNFTFKANEVASILKINSSVAEVNTGGTPANLSNNNVFLTNIPMVFQTVNNGQGVQIQGGQIFNVQDNPYTIFTGLGYNVDLSDITLVFYLFNPLPLSGPPPCCVANVCDANPQVANYDNQNLVHNASGGQLITAVSNFYAAAAAGQARPNAPPIFKTYQQMMDWKQRQNRR